MVKLVTYFGISTLLAIISIYHSYSIHEQFYPTVVYLTNNKLCILSLGNFSFCFILTIANIIIKIFFNEMADDETNEIMLRSKYSITEICIALTSFRNELNKTVIMLFVGLLFVKAFHWLTILRMENFQRGTQQNMNNNHHGFYTKCRLFIILIFLLFIDILCSIILSYLLYQQQRFSVIVLFAFEFTILSASIFTQICKFIVILIDHSYDGRWSYKPTIMFIFEFLHDLTHLGLYSIFIWILTVNWGFPLHLLRELFLAFHTLRNRIIQFYNYSKIIKVLDTQFNTITRQQLIDSQRDVICVICFSEMETGKELPCKHVFHLNCLKRWFEQKQECPMCRLKIVPNQQRQRVIPPQQQQQPQQNNDNQDGDGDVDVDDHDDDDNDDDNDEKYEKHEERDRYPSYSYQYPYHNHYYQQQPQQSPQSPQTHQTHQTQQPYYYPHHPYYQHYQHYQYNSYHKPDTNMDLEHLTRSTQRQIEYHEMCVNQLKLALEQYISLQSKWKNEDEEREQQ